jgi:hypothetical protein
MNEISENGQHPQFSKRGIQLAREFGQCVESYEELPEQLRQFFEFVGYVRVCHLLVIADLQKGRSERELANRYGLTRKQIQGIKENSRLCKRRQIRI